MLSCVLWFLYKKHSWNILQKQTQKNTVPPYGGATCVEKIQETNLKQTKNNFYYIILSILAGALILALIFFSSSTVNTIDIYDKLFVGGAVISSCIFGISLAVYPSWPRRFTKRKTPINQKSQKTTRKRRGHHPDCEHFRNHTITIKNKVLCAGCLGLSLGAVVSIFLMIIYILFPDGLSQTILYIFIILGISIITLNYIEIIIPKRNAFVHLLCNVFLVISFFLIVISIFQLTGNIIYGLFGVILSFLWLDTRIQLSNWRHALICKDCSELCKMY